MTPKRPAGADAFPGPAVERSATHQPDESPLYAALDLGTHSCLLYTSPSPRD